MHAYPHSAIALVLAQEEGIQEDFMQSACHSNFPIYSTTKKHAAHCLYLGNTKHGTHTFLVSQIERYALLQYQLMAIKNNFNMQIITTHTLACKNLQTYLKTPTKYELNESAEQLSLVMLEQISWITASNQLSSLTEQQKNSLPAALGACITLLG